ncbi:MAG: bifunctional 2-C-methyl-D-erythritol 4-phosphate cytidylyltransferase/2-C-methyl-D-erythritol 2,4-cyclodiphosphate synthase [Hydrogenophilaceae bacterium]|jgi:2-C-methyl-D-erythritol 4-phosphate cytidylyltransferase/2-C-methyl-D-erythritol 2,4-cyclodiphosphate synthase|nr:bifunctional 2-C-methyl-D-erythritol 4-phosphate cytidylyltransferase/2-C-methyl-D-erythritol 2,4-cyclodiphosphate synthase [Hydrogenophilaceae bacterium]
MRIGAIVAAAGRGERAGKGLPKQYRALLGRGVIRWSLEALAQRAQVIAVVADPAHAPLLAAAAAGLPIRVVAGGATRTGSIRAGLEALAGEGLDAVLIHDAARPGVNAAVIDALIARLADADGAAPALPLADALKRTDGQGDVIGEAAREGLMRVQTPQAFRFAAIAAAYARAPADAAFDDDIAVLRAAGGRAALIAGDHRLMKLTYPEDFAAMEAMLAGAFVSVTGSGFDAHRFGDGDSVTLCGVRIAHERGMVGHSDADVAWHAITDALLGAIGAGDIGAHFPPSDPRWRGASSEIFLTHAARLVAEAGGRIVHVDVTLICERPKIGPHREAMRARTAAALNLPVTRVSVKATTTEQMGFTGRGEGLAAQATASVELPR